MFELSFAIQKTTHPASLCRQAIAMPTNLSISISTLAGESTRDGPESKKLE